MQVKMAATMGEVFTALMDGFIPFAGGTDVLVRVRARDLDLNLVGLERLDELKGIEEKGSYIEIGSCTTWSQIERDPLVLRHIPLLALAAREIGGPAIRNMGTIGGNICTASPAGDGLVALWAMGTTLEIVSREGIRSVDLTEFVSGPGRIELSHGELVSSVRVDKRPGWKACYKKVGKRKSMAIAVGSLASMWRERSDTISDIRMALGSMAPRPVRSLKAEELLHGVLFSDVERFHLAGETLRDEAYPIDDIRASASYRESLAVNMLESLRLSICQGS